MQEIRQEILKTFSGIIKNLGFYPPEHPSIAKLVESIREKLAQLFSKNKELLVGVAEDILFFDDEQFYEMPPALEELKNRFEEKGITGLILRRGLTTAEITSLMQILALSPDRVPRGSLSRMLAENRIVNVVEQDVETDITERARTIYSNARETVFTIMREARLGQVPRAEKALETVRDMQDIILQDSNALLGLTMLSDYDNYTFNHSVNVGVLSSTLGNALGIGADDLAEIGLAGLLHDVGKTNTPIEIINKPGKLSGEEWAAIKRHPVDGSKIIGKMKGVGPNTSRIVLEHHAKFDLTGYPSFEAGHELHFGAMIVAVADTYDSMTTLRPYQKRFDPKEAISIMLKMKGSAFRPDYLDVFIKILGIYPVGALVRIDTGEIGLVCAANPEIHDRPKVKIIFDTAGRDLGDNFFEIDLTAKSKGAFERTIVASLDPMSKNIDLAKYN